MVKKKTEHQKEVKKWKQNVFASGAPTVLAYAARRSHFPHPATSDTISRKQPHAGTSMPITGARFMTDYVQAAIKGAPFMIVSEPVNRFRK